MERVLNAHASQFSPLITKLAIGGLRRLIFLWQRNQASVHFMSIRGIRANPPRFDSYTKLLDKFMFFFLSFWVLQQLLIYLLRKRSD